MGLGIQRNRNRFLQIGILVNIDMTVAIQVFDNWYSGIGANALNQAFAAAGHNHIHMLRHGNQLTYRSAVSGINNLHHILRQTHRLQAAADTGCNRLIRGNSLTAATQNSRITRL